MISGAWLSGPLWHAHEMVFGDTLAIVVGFLFIAGLNWSGQSTPNGPADARPAHCLGGPAGASNGLSVAAIGGSFRGRLGVVRIGPKRSR